MYYVYMDSSSTSINRDFCTKDSYHFLMGGRRLVPSCGNENHCRRRLLCVITRKSPLHLCTLTYTHKAPTHSHTHNHTSKYSTREYEDARPTDRRRAMYVCVCCLSMCVCVCVIRRSLCRDTIKCVADNAMRMGCRALELVCTVDDFLRTRWTLT